MLLTLPTLLTSLPRPQHMQHSRHSRHKEGPASGRGNYHGPNHARAHMAAAFAVGGQAEVGHEAMFEDCEGDEGGEPEEGGEEVEG